MKKKNVLITTVGCRLNQFESDILKTEFHKIGFETDENKTPDICIINTCTVTHRSDSKSKSLVKQIINKYSSAYVIVTGCLAHTNPELFKNIKGVNLIVDNFKKMEIPKLFSRHSSESNSGLLYLTDRTRPYIKIQDGCNLMCSYCKVRFARGKSRSENFDKIIQTANYLAEIGYPEIVITGVNIGDYYDNGKTLPDLLEELTKIEKLQRIRLTSIEPTNITDELLEVIKNMKICGYFHIPLQSGSNKILKLMNRPYQAEYYEMIVNKIKSIRPDSIIGTDIIVGFPEETEEDFLDTYNLLQKLDIFFLHIFRYSKREQTPAALLKNQIPEETKSKRSDVLKKYRIKRKYEFFKSLINREFEVIVENKIIKNNYVKSLTDNYIPVLLEKEALKFTRKIIKVKVTEFDGENLYGKIL